MKRIISTSAAPAAVGPYSQGVEASGATLYVSGQLPIDPADGTMPDTVEQQTEQALRNVEAILREAGYSLSDVVKSVVLLADMNDFAAMNSVYARFYAKDMPVCRWAPASKSKRSRSSSERTPTRMSSNGAAKAVSGAGMPRCVKGTGIRQRSGKQAELRKKPVRRREAEHMPSAARNQPDFSPKTPWLKQRRIGP